MSEIERVNEVSDELIKLLQSKGGAIVALNALTIALGKVAGLQARGPDVNAKQAWDSLYPLFEVVFCDAKSIRWTS